VCAAGDGAGGGGGAVAGTPTGKLPAVLALVFVGGAGGCCNLLLVLLLLLEYVGGAGACEEQGTRGGAVAGTVMADSDG
jgi:hypothetical protein